MKLNLRNKKILLTGGTRGIGKNIRDQFIEQGAKVIITGTKKSNYYNLPSKLHDYIQLDTTSNVSLENFFDQVNKLNHIDVLINNMGVNRINNLIEIQPSEFDFILNTNLTIPFRLSKVIAKKMIKKNKGKILNISSIWSIVSKPKRSSYASSKSGLNGLTRTLATELGKNNILVNSLSPGIVYTEMTKKNLGKEINTIKSQIPLKRLADTSEIGSVVVFLCSDLNTYITGQNIVVDGGYTVI
tara:strand:+ start:328 stop:1056 length:729 start_codon:yes stop_codon:yes gene_type:complete